MVRRNRFFSGERGIRGGESRGAALETRACRSSRRFARQLLPRWPVHAVQMPPPRFNQTKAKKVTDKLKDHDYRESRFVAKEVDRGSDQKRGEYSRPSHRQVQHRNIARMIRAFNQLQRVVVKRPDRYRAEPEEGEYQPKPALPRGSAGRQHQSEHRHQAESRHQPLQDATIADPVRNPARRQTESSNSDVLRDDPGNEAVQAQT